MTRNRRHEDEYTKLLAAEREVAKLRIELAREREQHALDEAMHECVYERWRAQIVTAREDKERADGRVTRLLSRIRRAASHLPGNPDAAEQILSEILGQNAAVAAQAGLRRTE